jgi:DNA-binding CsgD family transcriptional regulator
VRAHTIVPLTEREREIALLAAAGATSKAIGGRLFLSARTVENHLGRIYDKVGVSSRAALAAALDRHGGRR